MNTNYIINKTVCPVKPTTLLKEEEKTTAQHKVLNKGSVKYVNSNYKNVFLIFQFTLHASLFKAVNEAFARLM